MLLTLFRVATDDITAPKDSGIYPNTVTCRLKLAALALGVGDGHAGLLSRCYQVPCHF